jgi:hypothetical protein
LVRRRQTGTGAATGFGTANFPGNAKLFDSLGQLAGSHGEVVAPTAVEVAAEAAESALERRRHRHIQEALTVPQQFHSWTNWMTTDVDTNSQIDTTRMDRKRRSRKSKLTEIRTNKDVKQNLNFFFSKFLPKKTNSDFVLKM